MTTPQPIIDRTRLQVFGLSLDSANVVMDEIERLRAEVVDTWSKLEFQKSQTVDLAGRLENAQKQASALREALVRLCNSWAEGSERENYEAMKEAKAAISGGVGREFISREQVKPLVEALKEFLSWLESEGFKTKPADDALEHARKLGL